mmetsp:Transcript_36599/g.92438  ORF Transcript_36599/g.92438 Transcript_36599/m.92438 type:complete len:478 (+) Transcript_36599:2654-4087(+)
MHTLMKYYTGYSYPKLLAKPLYTTAPACCTAGPPGPGPVCHGGQARAHHAESTAPLPPEDSDSGSDSDSRMPAADFSCLPAASASASGAAPVPSAASTGCTPAACGPARSGTAAGGCARCSGLGGPACSAPPCCEVGTPLCDCVARRMRAAAPPMTREPSAWLAPPTLSAPPSWLSEEPESSDAAPSSRADSRLLPRLLRALRGITGLNAEGGRACLASGGPMAPAAAAACSSLARFLCGGRPTKCACISSLVGLLPDSACIAGSASMEGVTSPKVPASFCHHRTGAGMALSPPAPMMASGAAPALGLPMGAGTAMPVPGPPLLAAAGSKCLANQAAWGSTAPDGMRMGGMPGIRAAGGGRNMGGPARVLVVGVDGRAPGAASALASTTSAPGPAARSTAAAASSRVLLLLLGAAAPAAASAGTGPDAAGSLRAGGTATRPPALLLPSLPLLTALGPPAPPAPPEWRDTGPAACCWG